MYPQGSETCSVNPFPAAEMVRFWTQMALRLNTIVKNPDTVSYLEDGKHYAAEGSVIGELCHTKDIKAPHIQVVQLLTEQEETSTHIPPVQQL